MVTVDGEAPEPLSARNDGASAADFHGVLRKLGDPGPDPTVTMHRRRRVEPTGGTETLTLANRARAAITVTVAVDADADFAPMGVVKDGRLRVSGSAVTGDGWRADDGATASLVAIAGPGRRHRRPAALAGERTGPFVVDGHAAVCPHRRRRNRARTGELAGGDRRRPAPRRARPAERGRP